MPVNVCASKATKPAGNVYTSVLFTLFVEISSKRAVEDNDFVMPWEDTAADVVQGTREEKARNSP